MLTQTAETPTVLKESNETFDLVLGDLEIEIPELLASSHVGTTPASCDSHTSCDRVYCS